MNELQIFKNYLFGEVRTVLIENEVWFVLIDVCRALNLTNSRMVASRLDDDEVSKFDLRGQSGETHIEHLHSKIVILIGCDSYSIIKAVSNLHSKIVILIALYEEDLYSLYLK